MRSASATPGPVTFTERAATSPILYMYKAFEFPRPGPPPSHSFPRLAPPSSLLGPHSPMSGPPPPAPPPGPASVIRIKPRDIKGSYILVKVGISSVKVPIFLSLTSLRPRQSSC